MLWIPGRLYLPKNHNHKLLTGPISGTHWEINPACEVSYWTSPNDHVMYQAEPLQKAGWLSGHNHKSTELKLPAQVRVPEHHLPVYVLPLGWHTHALKKIQDYQRSL
jgi:hypothetical protein